MWIWKNLISLGLILVVFHVSEVKAQVCMQMTKFGLRNCVVDKCYQCTISTSSQYATIPEDAVGLSLAFSSGSSGLDSPGAKLPNLPRLQELEMSLSNLGPSPLIPSGFFSGVGQLDSLTIYHDSHSSVGFQARLVNGSFNGLSGLTRLIATLLGIEELPVGVFKDLVNLRYLDLNQNRLKGVSAGTFAPLKQLVTLSLLGNQIQSLANVSFAGLESLQTINLHGNEIRSLGRSLSFLALGNLTVMNLGSNQMLRIDPYVFTGLRRLDQLLLDSNNLTELTVNVFNDLTSLTKLSLKSNAIQRLSGNLFSHLGSLKVLDLSDNHLVSVPDDISNGLQKLRSLNMHTNRILSVDGRSFEGLESLEVLDLGENQMAAVDPAAFRSLRRLHWLDLSSNNLTSLELGTTDGLDVKVLSHLDLSLNPWNCSCINYWLVLWLRINNLTSILSNPDSTKCQSPLAQRGRTLLAAYVDTNHSCPFPFPVQTTEEMVPSPPTGSARISEQGVLSKEAQIGIIVGAVVFAVLIIVIVGVIVHFLLKRMGFWDRKRAESAVGVMHRDATKNDSATSDSRLRPEVASDGGYDNRWVVSDDGSSGKDPGELGRQYRGSGSGDVGFEILSTAGSPSQNLQSRTGSTIQLISQHPSYVYDNPTLVDDGRHM